MDAEMHSLIEKRTDYIETRTDRYTRCFSMGNNSCHRTISARRASLSTLRSFIHMQRMWALFPFKGLMKEQLQTWEV